MNDFFFNYGLFAAKLLTIFILIGLALLGLGLALSTRSRDDETIEIDKINEKFELMQKALEQEILSAEERKLLKKTRKQEEKQNAKLEKKRIKQGLMEAPLRPRLFLLKFEGDLHASAVDNLREAITAVLTVVKPQDEVLLMIDSPGGIVHNYGLAASQVKRLRDKHLKVTASVDLVAASGGYLMASVAETIIAAPFAIVGSIGVFAQIPNFHRLLEKNNVDIEQFTAGEYKTTVTMLGKNTDKDRKKFTEEIQETHDLFKQFVLEHRPQLDMEKLATGEHWYGTQALNLKLVDELITSDDYLLKKSQNADIYEVNYVFKESLADKMSTIFQGFMMRCMNTCANLFRRSRL